MNLGDFMEKVFPGDKPFASFGTPVYVNVDGLALAIEDVRFNSEGEIVIDADMFQRHQVTRKEESE